MHAANNFVRMPMRKRIFCTKSEKQNFQKTPTFLNKMYLH
jgi:hypothetical protein